MNTAFAPQPDIQVRHMNFQFDEKVPDYWYDNSPLLTLFLTALSATFPEGEKQFINSVRYFQDQIDDPQLQKQIRAFIGQEAHHSKEHDALNGLMKSKGFAVARVEKRMVKAAKFMRKRFSKERQLAHTVCAEHLTAIIADFFLRKSPDELEKLAPEVRKLWAWHVAEEIEHKAVAFDVYRQTVDDDFLRRSHMLLLTFLFVLETTASTLQLMKHSNNLNDPKMWVQGFRYFLAPRGMIWRLLPDYLDFFRKDFHPWQHNNSDQLKFFMERFSLV